MTTSISPGLLNQLLGSGGFKETMDGSEFRLYSGLVPAAAGDSIGAATLLWLRSAIRPTWIFCAAMLLEPVLPTYR